MKSTIEIIRFFKENPVVSFEISYRQYFIMNTILKRNDRSALGLLGEGMLLSFCQSDTHFREITFDNLDVKADSDLIIANTLVDVKLTLNPQGYALKSEKIFNARKYLIQDSSIGFLFILVSIEKLDKTRAFLRINQILEIDKETFYNVHNVNGGKYFFEGLAS